MKNGRSPDGNEIVIVLSFQAAIFRPELSRLNLLRPSLVQTRPRTGSFLPIRLKRP